MNNSILDIIHKALPATVNYYSRNQVDIYDTSNLAYMLNQIVGLLFNNLIPNSNTAIPVIKSETGFLLTNYSDFLVIEHEGFKYAISIFEVADEYELVTAKADKLTTDVIIYRFDKDAALVRASRFLYETMSNGEKFNIQGMHLVPYSYFRNKDLKKWAFPELSVIKAGKIVNLKVSEL